MANREAAGGKRARTAGATRVVTPSDVRLIPTGLIALGLTAFFYAALIQPFGDTYVGALFGARGWVPYVIALLSIWSIVMLAGKYRVLREQAGALELDLLPERIGERISPDNADRFSESLHRMAGAHPGSFLIDRVARALDHFRGRGEIRDAVDQLSSQADADANAVEASYTMVKVFVWAIPILGFIGTVIGIGDAVGGFSDSVGSAASLEVMKNSIGVVTSGLGVAFDTTLLALVMSIIIMFPTSSLQKAEEGFLAEVEEYCYQHLVRRLEVVSVARTEIHEDAIERAVAQEMAKHHAALRSWTERLEQAGGAIREDVVQGWQVVDGQMRDREASQREALDRWLAEKQRELAQQAASVQREVLSEFRGSFDEANRTLGELQRQGSQHLDAQLTSLERFGDSIRDLQQQEAVAQRDASRVAAEGAERLVETLDQVRQQAERFQVQAAQHLGQLVVQVEQFARNVGEAHRVESETQRHSAKAASDAARHLGETLEHVRGELDRSQSQNAQHVADLVSQVKAFSGQVRDLQRTEARMQQAQAEDVARSSDNLARTLEHVRQRAEAAEHTIGVSLAGLGPRLSEQMAGLGEQVVEPWRDQIDALERLHRELAQGMVQRTEAFESFVGRLDRRLEQLGETIERASQGASGSDGSDEPRRGLRRFTRRSGG